MDSALVKDLSLEAVGTGAIFVLGLLRGWWVMGSQVKDLKEEIVYWRNQYNALAVDRIPPKKEDN